MSRFQCAVGGRLAIGYSKGVICVMANAEVVISNIAISTVVVLFVIAVLLG